MGRTAICKVGIEFKSRIGTKIINMVKGILEKHGVDFCGFQDGVDWIFFEMIGYKSIDYECLEEIKGKLSKEIERIYGDEFVETGDGYYYENSEK